MYVDKEERRTSGDDKLNISFNKVQRFRKKCNIVNVLFDLKAPIPHSLPISWHYFHSTYFIRIIIGIQTNANMRKWEFPRSIVTYRSRTEKKTVDNFLISSHWKLIQRFITANNRIINYSMKFLSNACETKIISMFI